MIVGSCAQCLGITSESAFWTQNTFVGAMHSPMHSKSKFYTQFGLKVHTLLMLRAEPAYSMNRMHCIAFQMRQSLRWLHPKQLVLLRQVGALLLEGTKTALDCRCWRLLPQFLHCMQDSPSFASSMKHSCTAFSPRCSRRTVLSGNWVDY